MTTMTEVKSPFGAELRRLRIAAGRRQREVAEVLGGVSVPYVHDIERGNRNPPTLDRIGDVAELLGVPAEADRLAELAVEQRGSIRIIPQTAAQRRLLVVLDRQIRKGKVTKSLTDQIIKKIDR